MVLDPVGTAACCSPLSAEPLSTEQAEQVAPLLKALADPVRLRLMSLVASHAGGEACVIGGQPPIRSCASSRTPAEDAPNEAWTVGFRDGVTDKWRRRRRAHDR